ncbi:MAG: phosphonoacetaldehyde hydrolase [Spirochaetales bacterium]|nr:phosphonoacetaldehyde hydrolase [Spirochaetales bacterium]
MKNIELAVFDWAGTTIDYGCVAPLGAFVSAFKSKNIEINLDEARAPMGMKKRDHVAAILDMERVKQLWQQEHGNYASEKDIDELYSNFESSINSTLADYCTPIPGAIKTIEKLKAKGIKIGSTTGYTGEMMKIVAPGAEAQGYKPDNIVNSTDVPAGRPYPYMVWSNAITLNVPNLNHIVKVGDTKADIAEGLSAGVWTVAIIEGSSVWAISEEETKALSPTDYHKRYSECKKVFMEAGAHYVIKDITELPEIMEIIDIQIELGKRA